jgi:hypothetical protein
MRVSADPDYYYNKRLREEKRMIRNGIIRPQIPEPPPTPPSSPPPEPIVKEKKKPGRKKKIPAPKNPIMREEKTVIVRWD